MITIVTRWESSQMPADLEWRMWKQLRGAFEVGKMIFTPVKAGFEGTNWMTQFPTMEEALANAPTRRVFLEPEGDLDLDDANVVGAWDDIDLAIVLGNTEQGNMHLVRPGDDAVQIRGPGVRVDLYGTNAAAIALAHWYGQ